MLIQYSSDIHLEFRSIDQVSKIFKNIGADVLILAGDICAINLPEDYEKFIALLTYYTPKYKYILHIAGNHEYYSTADKITKDLCMDSVNRKLKALTKTFSNYLYLNCDTVTLTIDNKPYMFIGATLWTKVNLKDRLEVQNRMNDYENIFMYKDSKCVKFTVADMQRLHSKHVLFIKKAVLIAAKLKIPTVLITHHKPVGDTLESARTILTQAYECDITDIVSTPVKLAIHGHCHISYDKTIKGVRYVSNPLGYPGQHTKFQSKLGIVVK